MHSALIRHFYLIVDIIDYILSANMEDLLRLEELLARARREVQNTRGKFNFLHSLEHNFTLYFIIIAFCQIVYSMFRTSGLIFSNIFQHDIPKLVLVFTIHPIYICVRWRFPVQMSQLFNVHAAWGIVCSLHRSTNVSHLQATTIATLIYCRRSETLSGQHRLSTRTSFHIISRIRTVH